MYIEIPIYFNDLKEDKQQELLELIGESDPKDMNWDINIIPIAYYCTETEE